MIVSAIAIVPTSPARRRGGASEQPLSSSAAGGIGVQVLLGTSHTKPRAQSSLELHAPLHAPNAGSQR